MDSTNSTDIPTPTPDSDHSDVDHDSAEAMRSVWMALHSNDPSSSKPTPQAIQNEPSDVSPRRERPICRLVVISSGVLSKGRTHAIIEPHDVVKVGRDKQPEPLLRLKELAVSKHHASIFWDDERLEWAIVDLGSVHGTWLSPQDIAGGSNEQAEGQRLSAPRTASMPRRLLHGDTLTIGSSKFSVHIHDSGQSCPGCGVGPANTIPLLPDSTENPVTSHTASTSTSAASNPPRVSHKAAMQSLRQTLLQPGRRSTPPSQEPTPTRGPSTYQDRSRKRREMFGTEGGGTEGSSSSQPTPREKRPRYDDPRVSAVLGPETPIDEATSTSSNQTRPIDESNIGHRLLMKKGWTPGETLGLAGGDSRRALLEPLQVVKREGQSGLGSR